MFMRGDTNQKAETMRFLRDTNELCVISPPANRTSPSTCSNFSLTDWWKNATRNRRAHRAAKKLSQMPFQDTNRAMQALERAVWFRGRMWVVGAYKPIRVIGSEILTS